LRGIVYSSGAAREQTVEIRLEPLSDGELAAELG